MEIDGDEKSDSEDLTNKIRAFYAAGAGNVVVVLDKDGDSDARTIAVSAGEFFDKKLLIRRIKDTGTTATGIIGFW